MTLPLLVPPGEVRRVMRARSRRLLDLRAHTPARRRPTHRLVEQEADPGQVVDSVEGFVEHISDGVVEALLFEDGRAVPYTFPSAQFERADIRPGERFWIDVVQVGTTIDGRLRRAEPEPTPPGAEGPRLSPDDLDALADPW